MSNLFRKSSIERLSNPDQLDKAISVSSPMSWLALIAVAVIIIAAVIWAFTGTLPTTQNASGILADADYSCAYHSDRAGHLERLLKEAGDEVKEGEGIAVITSATGKEHTVKADYDGVLTSYLVAAGSDVASGTELARFKPTAADEQVVVCYIPVMRANQLEEGMSVQLCPYNADSQECGYMQAEIIYISDYAANTGNMIYVSGADNLVMDQFLAEGPVVAVACNIKKDASSANGYYWSKEQGKEVSLVNGSFISAKIIIDESAPITKLFSGLDK